MDRPAWLGWGAAGRHGPRSTVRLRLTLLIGGLIVATGVALLAVTFVFGSRQSNTDVNWLVVGGPPVSGANSGIVSGVSGVVVRQITSSVSSSGSASGTPTIAGGPLAGISIAQAHVAATVASTITLHALLLWSGIALGAITLASLVLGWAVSGRILRPLRQMTLATQQISEENLHERLYVTGPSGDELQDLGDTINGLLGRLETAFDAQGRFVQNASHELRTPLTMMRTSLEVATGKAHVPDEVRVLAGKVNEGLDHAERLLESFLVLARVQQGANEDRAFLDLAGRVETVVGSRRDAIEVRGLVVELDLQKVVVDASEILLERLVANLVDNAIGHNEAGGWIRISTIDDGSFARLVVENGGARLDPARVAKLSQPFQRIGADRTAQDGGLGLGLSIVAAIAKSHDGTTTLIARPEGGLRVSVELPPARRPALAGGWA